MHSVLSRVAANLRQASGQFRHERFYAALMVVTLAIGIAAASAICAVVRGVVLRPLPYPDAESIVSIQEYQPARRRDQSTVAPANWPSVAAARSLAGVSGFSYSEYVVSGDADAERIVGARVDGELLRVLGVRPALGRGVTREEAGPNPARVAVLSDALWRRRFGADPNVVGRSITIDGAQSTIVGVMPDGFEFPRNPSMSRDVDVWVPRQPASPMMLRRGMRDLTVVARLQHGVTLDAAQHELSAIARRAALDNVALDGGWQMRVIGLRDVMVGQVRPALTMLAASVGLLLLIACANASAGALARITTKRQALGVRIALGATRENIIALLASESVLLALVAAMVALPSSVVIRRVLVQFAPVTIPRQAGIAVDGWTILFALGVGAITGLVTVLGPALWLRHLDVSTFLSDAGRSSTHSRARRRTSSMFVVVQLALATVLVSATARVYSTFSRLDRVDPGFARDHITTATLALGGMRYQSAAARLALTSQLLEKVRALPGVEHAAVTSLLPLSGGLMSSAYSVRGMATDSSRSAALRAVSADFFTALGIPIRRGRAIDAGDNARAVRVAVVNEAFERESFAGRSAIGQSLVLTPPGSDTAQEFEIVGIAGDAKEKDLLGPATPIIYFSDAQASFPHTVLAVRARGDFPAAGVRAALRDLDPPLALDDVGPLGERVRASYALQLFLLWILGAFAVSGALLIAVGIYGSVSFSVAAELRSIGVRMAVGATPQGILGAVLGRGAVLASLGCTLGVGVAVLLPRVGGLERLLGTSVGLAAAVVGACAVLFVALIATAIPARRASTLDPVIVLRSS